MKKLSKNKRSKCDSVNERPILTDRKTRTRYISWTELSSGVNREILISYRNGASRSGSLANFPRSCRSWQREHREFNVVKCIVSWRDSAVSIGAITNQMFKNHLFAPWSKWSWHRFRLENRNESNEFVNVNTFYDKGMYKGCWFALAQLFAQLFRVRFVPSKKLPRRETFDFNAEFIFAPVSNRTASFNEISVRAESAPLSSCFLENWETLAKPTGG